MLISFVLLWGLTSFAGSSSSRFLRIYRANGIWTRIGSYHKLLFQEIDSKGKGESEIEWGWKGLQWIIFGSREVKPEKQNHVLVLLPSNLQDNNKHPSIPSHFHPTSMAIEKGFLLTAPTSHLLPTFSQTSHMSVYQYDN